MKTFKEVVAEARIAFANGTINRDIHRIAGIPTEMTARELVEAILYLNRNRQDIVLEMVLEEQGAFHGFKMIYDSNFECYTFIPVQYFR